MRRRQILLWTLSALLVAPVSLPAQDAPTGADAPRLRPTTLLSAAAGPASPDEPAAIGADGSGASAPPAGSAKTRPRPPAIPDAVRTVGGVTGFALPRFVSLKKDRVRARRGPGEQWRVDWEFVALGMPLEVVAEHGNWRRVRDAQGHGGWVHHIFLDGRRSAIVTRDMAALRVRPDEAAAERARVEAGAILRVSRCAGGWCEVAAGDSGGWIEDVSLWGVGPGETFE